MDEDRVQFPDGPLIQMGWHVPRGRLILARSVGGFDSLSVHSTLRKVAGYGLPGRTANACHHRGDEGSNPLPSTIWNRKPFGENVEGLSYCGAKSYVVESAVQPDDFKDLTFLGVF